MEMKDHINLKSTIILVLMLATTFLFSQTSEQTKSFVNRSMKAVYKVQKEIYKQNITSIDPAFKKAVKFQAIAVKLYQQNNFADAIGYAYKSRAQALALLNTLDANALTNLNFNNEENAICTPSQYGGLNITPGLLTTIETNKIDSLNSADYPEFRKLLLSIPIQ